MTASEATLATAARAVVVAAVWFALAPQVAAAMRTRWGLASAAIIAVTPSLLPGYVYRQTTLTVGAVARESLMLALMLAITLPLAAVAACLVRPTVDDRAAAAAALAGITGRARLMISLGRRRPQWAAALIAAVWTLQEAELGILLQAVGWPEWTLRQLRGARTGRELIGELWPVLALQAGLVTLGLGTLRATLPNSFRPVVPAHARHRAIGLALTLAGVGLVIGWPLVCLAREAAVGLGGVFAQSGLWRTLAWSHLLAALAAGLAWGLTTCLSRQRLGRTLLVALVGVGLAGPLLVALSVQAICQFVRPQWFQHPVPHLASVVLTLLPKAAVLAGLVAATRDRRAEHAAELAAATTPAASRLVFAIRDRPRLIALTLLAWAAYFDVMAASVLAAPALETTPLQLYNFVHFGQIVTLAAWLLLATAIPLAMAFVVFFVVRGQAVVVRRS